MKSYDVFLLTLFWGQVIVVKKKNYCHHNNKLLLAALIFWVEYSFLIFFLFYH